VCSSPVLIIDLVISICFAFMLWMVFWINDRLSDEHRYLCYFSVLSFVGGIVSVVNVFLSESVLADLIYLIAGTVMLFANVRGIRLWNYHSDDNQYTLSLIASVIGFTSLLMSNFYGPALYVYSLVRVVVGIYFLVVMTRTTPKLIAIFVQIGMIPWLFSGLLCLTRCNVWVLTVGVIGKFAVFAALMWAHYDRAHEELKTANLARKAAILISAGDVGGARDVLRQLSTQVPTRGDYADKP
jgi:hypothetical protein